METHLKSEVCAGRMTLKDVQDIIRTDWFKYYRDSVLNDHLPKPVEPEVLWRAIAAAVGR